MRTVLLPFGSRVARIEVDETDHIGRIISCGTWYEKDLLNDARRRVTGPGTAVDVGAHIGNHALWFAIACGLDVIALEPNPETYVRLAANIQDNQAPVRAIAAAAGAEPGWATIIPPRPGNTGTAAVSFDGGDIPVTTIDSIGMTRVKLIKIDVEGSAAAVLEGAVETIETWSPVVYAEGSRNEIAQALPAGYECFGRFAKTPTYGFSR